MREKARDIEKSKRKKVREREREREGRQCVKSEKHREN